jgi:DNA-directed RNA polymerase subunit M/transcription elongation factor TFIIS
MDKDKYSRDTIELLLQRDIKYLSELAGCDIPHGSTVDTVIDIIYSKSKNKKTEKEQHNYTCKKCHSNSVVMREEQLRSADEGSTTVYKCDSCGYKWY